MNRLGQFWHYVTKVFALPARLRAIGDERPQPVIPPRVLSASLLLGAVLRVPSFLQLEAESTRRGWQRLVGWPQPISDDALGYVLERYRIQDWRAVLVAVNRTLKANKAFESAKINGRLVVALDGNEQFKSQRRCCPDCCQRRLEVKDAHGQPQTVTEYYHRQVYAQLHGPDFSVILDVEPIRPGEDEAAAALRLLGRMRRLYGPRFFDVVTVDAWYATGPFLKAVQRLGWGVVSVLKQERYEIYQEATALSREQTPRAWQWEDRAVDLWEVKDLPFTDAAIGPVRVVLAEERWTQRQRRAGQTQRVARKSQWRWLVSRELDDADATVIWRIGHQRWGVENHAFNELTQHYHLTHCPRHEATAIQVWLLILVLGFNLFELFARRHGKLWRQGRLTLQELARQLDRALEAVAELRPLWSG
jgi:Transposase DDE domain